VLSLIHDLVDTVQPLPHRLSVVLPDVEADAGAFGAQVKFAERRGHPVACLLIGDVPIPIAAAPPEDRRPAADPDQAYVEALHVAGESAAESGIETVFLPPRDAQAHFLRRVRDFVAARFLLHPAGSAQAPVPFPFRVVTQEPGWRVRRCGAYLAKSNATVFGAPTTPVTGTITAGRYIFGLDAPGRRLRWDKGEFDVPPSVEAVLVVG
jgi:hypothetical protein